MRWLLDEMLPRAAVDALNARGHEAVSVVDIDMRGASDDTVYATAVEQSRIVVTEDEDDFERVLMQAFAAGGPGLCPVEWWVWGLSLTGRCPTASPESDVVVAESFVGQLRLFVVGIAIVAFDEPQMQFEVMELDARSEEVKKLIRLAGLRSANKVRGQSMDPRSTTHSHC